MSSRKRIALIVFAILGASLLLTAWLRTGSLEVVVEAAKLPPVPAAPVATEFTAVAYNVQARPVFDDSEYKFARMPKVLEPYDIITFQEMFKDHDLMYAGLSHPVKVYHSTLLNWWRIVGSGLGTVSRFPLEKADAIVFQHAGDFQNKPASKGVLFTRFLVGGNPLDVYTTHKAAGRKEESTRDKPRQAAELVEFVKKNSPPENAVIVLGDFNLRFGNRGEAPRPIPAEPPATFEGMPIEDVIGAICAHLNLKDMSWEVNGKPTDDPDHILFRSGTKATLTPLSCVSDGPEFYDENKKELSDHVPVIGKFRIAPVTQ